MELTHLSEGMPIVWGGDRVSLVPKDLADSFHAGDRLIVVQDTGDLLHVPQESWKVADEAARAAERAFSQLGGIDDAAITTFYQTFADRLADEASFAPIAAANASDIESARSRGRSTTRLELTPKMRQGMIAGLRQWASLSAGRNEVVERIDHDGWMIEQVTSGLGVVGFVFEGRPNVFADATGVLRSGNTVVFRIGSDALGTARAIVINALDPAIEASGLPQGSVSLVDSPARSAGWALFSHPALDLAVARGSGAAVSQLGAVARQSGTPVSLHGTGGAWIVADEASDPDVFAKVVEHSLDRKVCNTLNTCCITRSAADRLLPRFLEGLEHAARTQGTNPKLWIVDSQTEMLPEAWFEETEISRAEGLVPEPMTSTLGWEDLGREWEWEQSPEVTVAIVDDVDHAVRLFNDLSPRFVASLVTTEPSKLDSFFAAIDAPFVGNGFTRWVDGQYALDRPELGLSNWQFGRLFGRAGILSGNSVFTVRSRVMQYDEDLKR